MNLAGLLAAYEALPLNNHMLTALRQGGKRGLRLPITFAARPWLLAGLQKVWSGPILIVCPTIQRARQLQDQLIAWSAAPEDILLFPEPDALFYERIAIDPANRLERLTTLSRMQGEGAHEANRLVTISTARAAMQKLMSPEEQRSASRTLRVGGRLDLKAFLSHLVEIGYEPAVTVQEAGSFARRGGIVDVFSPASPQPFRLELFGDEIESVRLFDPFSQRSEAQIEAVTVAPAREALPALLADKLPKASGNEDLEIGVELVAESEEANHDKQYQLDLDRLRRGDGRELLDIYAPYGATASLLDYAAPDTLVVLDDPDQIIGAVDEAERQSAELRAGAFERGMLPPDFPMPYFVRDELVAKLAQREPALRLAWQGEAVGVEENRWEELVETVEPAQGYGGKMKAFLNECVAAQKRQARVVVISHQADRLAELFQEKGIAIEPVADVPALPAPGSLTLVKGTLAEGFVVKEAEGFGVKAEGSAATEPTTLTLFTDAEIFGWSKPRRRVTKKAASPALLLNDLEAGDFVVHVEHGIGHFRGLQMMNQDGAEREYLVLEYADDDKLYVPTDQIGRVTRYIGAGGGQPPALHRLGTADWARVKDRVKKAVQDVAKDLLEIYATRQVKEGFAFSSDGAWLHELEASFPYMETPDQLQVIQEVKGDMEKPKPMDRLVCGDVGYGKTEVALRAAFKAVLDNKQVAVLVPTTVLAQQHFKTFVERLQSFPVRVEVLSRFRSEKDTKKVLADLAAGSVDICIGTHRLIQRDVQFHNLGLVIIDEEQRFGVMHKERLKQLRKEVDVLTLTATPIPRTLHMAMVGVRDMSTMETPPEDRLPIKTFVTEFDNGLIREAILRELDRGGQIYFVHNRVQNIHFIAEQLRKLIPEASIAVGHGQMHEDQLERVMLDFANGKHDVLVCSTIIESGLDIPNVNTIIVNQADRFGLAQLYQLRGRVGRGAVRAYAYILYNKDKTLTPQAEKRLRTMFEATELGSGFRIAMRDLEIRGAGNLLGAEQHGHVAAVGFTLYCQLLAEAIQEYQGEVIVRPPEIKLDLPVMAFLPSNYVTDDTTRLSVYQKMAAVSSLEAVSDMARELIDRFGTPPREVVNLICMLEVKHLASMAGIESIEMDGDQIVLMATGQLNKVALEQALGSAVQVGHRQARIYQPRLGKEWLVRLRDALEQIVAAQSVSAN